MNLSTLINSISTYFNATITGIIIVNDNAPPVDDAGAVVAQPNDQTWIRFTVLPGDSFQMTCGGIGSRRFRTPGVAVAQIFVPLLKGDKAAWNLADTVIAAFRGITVTNVTFRTPVCTVVGVSGGWWQVNVSCPFYADDIA